MPQTEPFSTLSHSRLRPLSAHILSAFATTAAPDALTAMIAGIQTYQAHTFRRKNPHYAEVWQAGTARLFFCPPASKPNGQAIVLIPSMINRAAILDLLPDRSFLRWLAGQGFAVYLLDWGDAQADAGQATIDSVIRERLLPALKAAALQHDAPVTALGYCMGGTLLASAMALDPAAVDKLIFLAAPWDFHAGDRLLQHAVVAGSASALDQIGQRGVLPAEWLQTLFAGLNADRTAAKYARFNALNQNGDDAHLFVAVEDWLNDGIDLPGEVGRATILDWYGANTLPDCADIRQPALVIAAAQDRLVPTESALALAAQLPHATALTVPVGHIGMMTGSRAENAVWKPLCDWLKS